MAGVILSGGVAVAVSLALTPLVRDAAKRWRLFDRPDSVRKLHAGNIPRLGGVAILLAYAWVMALLKFLGFAGEIPGITDSQSWWLALAAVGLVFITGLIDDLFGLNAWQKVLGQSTSAILVWLAGVQIHSVQGHALAIWWSLPLTVLWLVACSNAFNLIDGMDGLAAGVGLVAAATMFTAAFVHHNEALMVVTLPLCGALLGFLRYNFNPASIFMGDSGSLTIGFLLGCFGVLWSDKSATLLGMAAPVMAMAIPLLDASVSMTRRLLRHQRVFDGDRRHLHHRLLDYGLSPRQAVLLMYAACLIAATFSLLENTLNGQFGGLVIVLFCALIVVSIHYLGYVEFGTAMRLATSGQFRKVLDAEVHLHLLEEKLSQADTFEQCWEVIRGAYRVFGFEGAKVSFGGIRHDEVPGSSAKYWQVRIPLEDNQYINFYSRFDRDHGLRLSSSFVCVVEAALTKKLHSVDRSLALVAKSSEESGHHRRKRAASGAMHGL